MGRQRKTTVEGVATPSTLAQLNRRYYANQEKVRAEERAQKEALDRIKQQAIDSLVTEGNNDAG